MVIMQKSTGLTFLWGRVWYFKRQQQVTHSELYFRGLRESCNSPEPRCNAWRIWLGNFVMRPENCLFLVGQHAASFPGR